VEILLVVVEMAMVLVARAVRVPPAEGRLQVGRPGVGRLVGRRLGA